jgi:hypothetical protein
MKNFHEHWTFKSILVYRLPYVFSSLLSDCLGAVYTWKGGLKPKSTSGTPLGGWRPLEAGYLPKNKEVRNGLFRYKLKKKDHGPLSWWADFFKWS